MADSDPQPWFVRAFDASYLTRYQHRTDAEAEATVAWMADRRLFEPGGRLLDLCCGAGRHGIALARRGFSVVGLDLSADLLRHARARFASDARPARFTRASMRSLPFRDRAFRGCVQMFTAFGYFQADDDNRAVLREVARTLEPGHPYVLDLFNGPLIVRNLVAASETKLERSVVRETRRYDAATKRLEKHVEEHDGTGRVERRFESVRILDLAEGTTWLCDAGFTEIRTYGDYAGSAFDADSSPRMLFVATRG